MMHDPKTTDIAVAATPALPLQLFEAANVEVARIDVNGGLEPVNWARVEALAEQWKAPGAQHLTIAKLMVLVRDAARQEAAADIKAAYVEGFHWGDSQGVDRGREEEFWSDSDAKAKIDGLPS